MLLGVHIIFNMENNSNINFNQLSEMFPDLSKISLLELMNNFKGNIESIVNFLTDSNHTFYNDDFELAKMFQESENKMNEHTHRNQSKRKHLNSTEAIECDRELALNLSKTDATNQVQNALSDVDVATKIQLNLLHERYSSLDKTTLDELFIANQFSLSQTEEQIQAALGSSTIENTPVKHSFMSNAIDSYSKLDEIDLHGLPIKMALEALDDFLRAKLDELIKSSNRSLVIGIITGRGIHSVNNIPRMKMATTDYLLKRNIRHQEKNPGMIEAILRREDII